MWLPEAEVWRAGRMGKSVLFRFFKKKKNHRGIKILVR